MRKGLAQQVATAMGDSVADVQWLEDRRKGIGGTDAAAILCTSKWSSPLDVWLRKIGEAPEVEETEQMWWGKALEDLIARRFTETTGLALWDPAQAHRDGIIPSRFAVHPQHPELLASADRLVVGLREGAEIKTGNV